MLLTAGVAQAETLYVRLILSDSTPPYQQFSTAFSKALTTSNADVVVTESHNINDSNADLIITVGMQATELAAARSSVPVLAVMIPKAGYENLLAQTATQKSAPAVSRNMSAIYLDQPWDRRLDFLQATLPERRRVGLLHSPNTRIDIGQLRQNVAKRGGSLVTQPVVSVDGLFANLESVINDSDVLIAIPDGVIYSNSNIRNILLTSYRHNVPLIGLSQSYVNAGALCAIFSTPKQLAEQTSSAVNLFARTRRLPDSRYPDAYTIALNPQVARSLGIVLPTPEAIRTQMDKVRETRR